MAASKNTQNTDIRIGISDSSHELRIETSLDSAKVQALVEESLKNGTPLVITDVRGNNTVVPGNKISFVEFGNAPERRVGFAAL
jgi:hypothetical protein